MSSLDGIPELAREFPKLVDFKAVSEIDGADPSDSYVKLSETKRAVSRFGPLGLGLHGGVERSRRAPSPSAPTTVSFSVVVGGGEEKLSGTRYG
jgi:hypothetical protein